MFEPLFTSLSETRANTYALVLTSHGLAYTVRRSGLGWEIWVHEQARDTALALIAAYEAENPQERPTGPIPPPPRLRKNLSGLWVAVFLLACHLMAVASADPRQLIGSGGASAAHILKGELYRTVTALMLHADYVHLAGNLVGVAVFGSAVCALTGTGAGWLLILLSGMLGNLANAALFEHHHHSIGASTAVFGALGLLAAVQFRIKITTADERKRAWLPLAGGLALLGFLGSSEHTDITAHLFGFLAGIVLGFVYAVRFPGLSEPRYQRHCMAVIAVVIALSWLRVWASA